MPHSPSILPIYFCIVFAENHEAANEQYIFSFFSSGSELRGLRQDVLHLRHWRHDKEEVKKKKESAMSNQSILFFLEMFVAFSLLAFFFLFVSFPSHSSILFCARLTGLVCFMTSFERSITIILLLFGDHKKAADSFFFFSSSAHLQMLRR